MEGYNPSYYEISSSQHQPWVKTPNADLPADPLDHHVGSFTWRKKTVPQEEDFVSETKPSGWLEGTAAISGTELQNEKCIIPLKALLGVPQRDCWPFNGMPPAFVANLRLQSSAVLGQEHQGTPMAGFPMAAPPRALTS